MAEMSNRSSSFWNRLPRWSSPSLALLASDLVALFSTALIVASLRQLAGGVLDTDLHVHMSLFLLVAPMINWANELYSPTPPPVPEELRHLAIAVSLAYLGIAIYFFLVRIDDTPSRAVYLLAWFCSLGTVPLLRGMTRRLLARRAWWGVPTVFFGDPALVARLTTTLRRRPELGFRPMAYARWDDEELLETDLPPGLRQLHGEKMIRSLVRRTRRKRGDVCALLTMPLHADMDWRAAQVSRATRLFPTVVLLPEEFSAEGLSFWVRPLEIGNMLGLRVRQNLLDPKRLLLKRAMDLVLSVCIGVCVLPILLAICLAIRLETPGSALFRQARIGRDGREIRILKFRTMVQDAEACLARHLAANPGLQAEWDATQKLQNDPRITRVGNFLRRTSLDELPQLWNVLCGEMSLVGPRPIVSSEIAKYADVFDAYMRVRPGITGLWQVSGRSDLSYPERVRLDAWYISNWSTWLDLYILARTVPVVFEKKGAY